MYQPLFLKKVLKPHVSAALLKKGVEIVHDL